MTFACTHSLPLHFFNFFFFIATSSLHFQLSFQSAEFLPSSSLYYVFLSFQVTPARLSLVAIVIVTNFVFCIQLFRTRHTILCHFFVFMHALCNCYLAIAVCASLWADLLHMYVWGNWWWSHLIVVFWDCDDGPLWRIFLLLWDPQTSCAGRYTHHMQPSFTSSFLCIKPIWRDHNVLGHTFDRFLLDLFNLLHLLTLQLLSS